MGQAVPSLKAAFSGLAFWKRVVWTMKRAWPFILIFGDKLFCSVYFIEFIFSGIVLQGPFQFISLCLTSKAGENNLILQYLLSNQKVIGILLFKYF